MPSAAINFSDERWEGALIDGYSTALGGNFILCPLRRIIVLASSLGPLTYPVIDPWLLAQYWPWVTSHGVALGPLRKWLTTPTACRYYKSGHILSHPLLEFAGFTSKWDLRISFWQHAWRLLAAWMLANRGEAPKKVPAWFFHVLWLTLRMESYFQVLEDGQVLTLDSNAWKSMSPHWETTKMVSAVE